MIAFVAAIGAWFARRVGAWGIGSVATLAFLGPIGPILTGIVTAIGSAISAIFEIALALAKSPEGRVVLAFLALGLSFLYLRFHYIEEGKAEAGARFAATHKPCPALKHERGKR